MWSLRMAKSRHKLFRTKFLFCIKINSTYENVLQNTNILDLSEKRGSRRPIPVLGPRQKWVDFPPLFFQLSIDFLVDYCLLYRTYGKFGVILNRSSHVLPRPPASSHVLPRFSTNVTSRWEDVGGRKWTKSCCVLPRPPTSSHFLP